MGEGKKIPQTEGKDYRAISFGSANTVEQISPAALKSGTIIIRAWSVTNAVHIGWDEDVTVNDGFPLEEGDSLALDLDVNEQPVHGVAEDSGDELRVIVTR